MIVEHNVVEMDDKAKAEMVPKLMVVLCAEHNMRPILDTTHADRSGS